MWDFPGGSVVKNLPAMWETWVQPLSQKDPLDKEMATHSSILTWRVPWTEEPGGLQSKGSQSQTRLRDCHLRFLWWCGVLWRSGRPSVSAQRLVLAVALLAGEGMRSRRWLPCRKLALDSMYHKGLMG